MGYKIGIGRVRISEEEPVIPTPPPITAITTEGDIPIVTEDGDYIITEGI